jgi:signal transduction histidine kinase
MSLRQKLLLIFSLTVVSAVAAVAWTISLRTRQAFEEADTQRTEVLLTQFRREFQRHADEVSATVERLADSDRVARLALDVAQTGDAAPYLMEAAVLARDYELDYLEIIARDGTILSSAQWPARFGYKEEAATLPNQSAFLKREELADNVAEVGVFALRRVQNSEPPMYVLGGKRLDRRLLADLYASPETQVLLYPILAGQFDPQALIGVDGPVKDAERYLWLIEQARLSGQESHAILYITARRQDSVNATAMPLKAPDGSVLAVLVAANSRRALVEVQQHIRAIAYVVAGIGILLTIVASLWITSRLTRPIERLAEAAGEVAAGNWDTQVEVDSHDEVGALASSFNEMTRQLSEQRERLVQSERVASWRELARRLAHELKNPLFPLQLTVENLARARKLPTAEFDEVFEESIQTLSGEVANLKSVIARFSDFSKMPKPQLQEVNAVEALQRVAALYEPVLLRHQPPILLQWTPNPEPVMTSADPELLHRALSNLVLNSMDAMPNGGTLRLGLQRKDDFAEITISDTGTGMTAEECERLFTPYYTTKQNGTGLGLAIVQAVISDHQGTIRVHSEPGSGSTFVIDLPAIQPAKVATA